MRRRSVDGCLVRSSGLLLEGVAANRGQYSSELGPNPVDLGVQPFALGHGITHDLARLSPRLSQNSLAFASRLVGHLLRSPLGRDQRRAQELLQLAVAHQLALELLDPVGYVGTIAPDVLEACHHVGEKLVGLPDLVAEERLTEADVPDFYWRQSHGCCLPIRIGRGSC